MASLNTSAVDVNFELVGIVSNPKTDSAKNATSIKQQDASSRKVSCSRKEDDIYEEPANVDSNEERVADVQQSHRSQMCLTTMLIVLLIAVVVLTVSLFPCLNKKINWMT